MNDRCRNCPFMQEHTGKYSSGSGVMGKAGRVLKRIAGIAVLLAAAAFIIANWKQVSVAREIFHDHEYGEGGLMEPGYSYVARVWTEEHNARAELRQKIEQSDSVQFILPSGDVYLGPFDSAIVMWDGRIRIRNGGAAFIIEPDDAAFFRGGSAA